MMASSLSVIGPSFTITISDGRTVCAKMLFMHCIKYSGFSLIYSEISTENPARINSAPSVPAPNFSFRRPLHLILSAKKHPDTDTPSSCQDDWLYPYPDALSVDQLFLRTLTRQRHTLSACLSAYLPAILCRFSWRLSSFSMNFYVFLTIFTCAIITYHFGHCNCFLFSARVKQSRKQQII